jgi:hypothetical protein
VDAAALGSLGTAESTLALGLPAGAAADTSTDGQWEDAFASFNMNVKFAEGATADEAVTATTELDAEPENF